jgi:hypothetical protein
MDTNRYISEFLCTEGTRLDGLDEIFLLDILRGYTSVYKLYSQLKTVRIYGRNESMSMAYKNVHKRIHRIHKGGLIEVIPQPGGYKHGAINYRLTSRGLMYLFSELMTPKNIHEVMIKYPENILFKLFVYDYFEKETLEHSTDTLTSLLQNYIEECCQKIRLFVDSSLVDSYGAYKEEGYLQSGNFLKDILAYQLEWHKRSFILKVATLKDELIDWRDKKANDRQETLELLANDTKFMLALEEYGGEFRKGYDALITLRCNKR